jgi:hypothetical protein
MCFQVDMFEQLTDVVGRRGHVIAMPRLAVPAAVVRNYSLPTAGEKEHLLFPVVRVERPPHERL